MIPIIIVIFFFALLCGWARRPRAAVYFFSLSLLVATGYFLSIMNDVTGITL
jgi:hypothetical protein